jgi:hypothetical protein
MDARASEIAAHTFRLDVKGADVRLALQDCGVASILLKGRAFAQLLYGDADARDYSDVDLLVAPDDTARAQKVLQAQGFMPQFGGPAPIDLPSHTLREGSLHGGAWFRERDGVTIDLHRTLPQVSADPGLVWSELCRHTVTMDIGGAATPVLDRPASALLVALHAAHHGCAWGSAIEDLRRATERLDLACWGEALELASTLDAIAAMGTGLGLTPAGTAIAERLGLGTTPSFGLLLRWSNAPWGSSFLDALISQGGLGARIRLLWQLVWPKPPTLRLVSPLARRGTRGLVAAYAIRPAQLLRRAPAAVLARRRVRRSPANQ